MKHEFEEKTYESYFNNELSQKSSIYFPIGQVQEGFLGFDSTAFFTRRSKIWSFWGYPWFPGIPLKDIADEMERILSHEIENIPQMKVNLLFQYKRSQFLTKPNALEWDKWKLPYYRYQIYSEQHTLLMNIYNKFQKEVLVLYAAPAFHKLTDLIIFYQNREIISNSNFKKAEELNKHKKNTFIRSGTHSVAFSTPEEIANFDLINLLESITFDIKEKNNTDFTIPMTKL